MIAAVALYLTKQEGETNLSTQCMRGMKRMMKIWMEVIWMILLRTVN